MMVVGIDPGTKTGCGVWDMVEGRLIEVFTRDIYDVQAYLIDLRTRHQIILVVEDARKRGGGKNAAAKAQGAGSVKRDCALWATWAKRVGVPAYFRAPGPTFKGVAGEKMWREMTGWQAKTDDHCRDAAWQVYNTTAPHLALIRAHAEAQARPRVKPRQKPKKNKIV